MSTQVAQKTYKLLIVDDDDVIREGLVGYLSTYHEANYTLAIDASVSPIEGRQKLADDHYDLVISDINMPGEDGFSFVQFIRDTYPDTRAALITAYKVEDYIRNAKKTGVYNVIAKTAPFNFEELSVVVNNLLEPNSAFGLENYMQPGYEHHEYLITNSNGIMEAFTQLQTFLQACLPGDQLNDKLTAIIEAITNAVYHAAKTADGQLKYEKGQVIEALEPHEQVTIHWGKDSEKAGIAIADQGGRITADEVVYWLERNLSGRGLMDTHGRGVYLIHTLVDRLLVNIAPGRCTEMIMLNYFNSEFRNNKPIYINQIN